MGVYYEPDEVRNVDKAIRIWSDQLAAIHREITDKATKGRGKGKDKGFPPPFFDPWGPPPPMPAPMPPSAMPPQDAVAVEAPVLLQRQRIPQDGGTSGPKVFEATCLRGRELRWQPWPDVSTFNEDW